jgi:hypothetical protein
MNQRIDLSEADKNALGGRRVPATRYCVEWMMWVPEEDDGSRYDRAEWEVRTFQSKEFAQSFAKKTAKTNKWRQAWLYTDHAPMQTSPEWQWERDHDATEIFEG